MKKPRIAHIITAANDGGIEQMIHQICCGLAHSYEFSIFALLDQNSRATSFQRDGIRFRTFSARNKPGYGSWLPNTRSLFNLSSELIAWQPDIVQVHDFFPSVLGRLAAKMAHTPHTIATLHNTYDWLGRPHGLINRVLSTITDRVVGVSSACIEDSRRRDKLPAALYHVIFNGVNQDRFTFQPEGRNKIRAELNLPADAILVGNVGTISDRKGQDTLLQACLTLAPRYPNLHVAIVGSQRSHERRIAHNLKELASLAAIRGRVHFLEDRHDMPDVMSAFDIFSMPSRQEGFGIALAEAMLVGLPTILSDIPAFREVAGKTCQGFHQINDFVALAQHLESVISTLQKFKPNQQAGRSRAIEHFSEKAMLNGWSEIYGELSK